MGVENQELTSGGGRGIGLAITRAFAEGGATVVITYNSSDPSSTAASVSKEFGVPIHVYHCPGEKSDIVDDVVEKVAKDVGEIDIVIANAGVSMWKDSIDMTDCELCQRSLPLLSSAIFVEARKTICM